MPFGESAKFETMPREVAFEIFSLLPPESLLNLRSTSSTLKDSVDAFTESELSKFLHDKSMRNPSGPPGETLQKWGSGELVHMRLQTDETVNRLYQAFLNASVPPDQEYEYDIQQAFRDPNGPKKLKVSKAVSQGFKENWQGEFMKELRTRVNGTSGEFSLSMRSAVEKFLTRIVDNKIPLYEITRDAKMGLVFENVTRSSPDPQNLWETWAFDATGEGEKRLYLGDYESFGSDLFKEWAKA